MIAKVVGQAPNGAIVKTHMIYDLSDPFAVGMVFEDGEKTVPWTFAAELLLNGGGEGDVQVIHGTINTTIHLCSPNGEVTLHYPRNVIAQFCKQFRLDAEIEIDDDALERWLNG